MELPDLVSQQGRRMKIVKVKFGAAGFPEKEKGMIQYLWSLEAGLSKLNRKGGGKKSVLTSSDVGLVSRVKRRVTSAPASPLHGQLVPSRDDINMCYHQFPSMKQTRSIGSNVPDSSGCSTFFKMLLRQGHLWYLAEVSSHLPENDYYSLGLALHHTSFMSKSKRHKVFFRLWSFWTHL